MKHLQHWGVIGHQAVINLLSGQIETGRLNHALLITGPAQTGKSLLAQRIAQAVNCLAQQTRPCGACRACTMIERGIHPDIIHVEREKTSIKIDAIRAVQQGLSLPPLEAHEKVIILHDLQYASGEAMDSLLKTLEEPPSHTRIIVTASAAEDLLSTIVSRSQQIPLRLVPSDTIRAAIGSIEPDIDPKLADDLSKMAAGRPGWVISVLKDESLLEWRGEVFEALQKLLSSSRHLRFKYARDMAYSDGIMTILELWQSFWRDALLWSEGLEANIVNVDQVTAMTMLSSQSKREDIIKALQAVRTAQTAIQRNANKRMVLDVMLLHWPYIRL